MNKHFFMKKRKQNIKSISLFALMQIVFMPTAFAASQNTDSITINSSAWHPFISLGAGLALSSDFGESQTFPIVNPITDERYQYHANEDSQTPALFNVAAGVEWDFAPKWATQLGVEYDQQASVDENGDFVQGADVQSEDQYNYHYKALTRQVLAEGKLLYQVGQRVHPYALVALGSGINSAYGYNTNVPPFLTFTRQYEDNTETSFAYSVGVGVDVDVNEHMRVGVGYRFADLGDVTLGNASIDGIPVRGTLSESNVYANEFLAQITLLV
jgi:opacity protein-like surface antigen